MTMSAPLQHLEARQFPWEPGDVVILNDPYDCPGQHLPDVMIYRPMFHRGKRIGFTGAVAHMIDFGGGAPGSYLATATEIFQEGLRLPGVEDSARGETEHRCVRHRAVERPRTGENDRRHHRNDRVHTGVGEQVLRELVTRYDVATVRRGMAEIQNGSARLLRTRVKELAAGTYRAVDFVDDDGITDDPIRLELALTVKRDSVVADLPVRHRRCVGR